VLQGIWNEVYKGGIQGHPMRIKHLVEQGGAIHDVVHRCTMFLSTISINYSQAIQRAIEWRSSVSSNGLSVVGDFMSSSHLKTCEERQEAAEHLLHESRYMYLKTRDEMVEGELKVRKATFSISAYPLKSNKGQESWSLSWPSGSPDRGAVLDRLRRRR
jgi:hypothetical protein